MNKVLVMGLFILSILFAGFNIQNAYAIEATSEDSLRFYVGGKLGYTGLIMDNITNLTAGKARQEFSSFESTFPIGFMAGMQYKFTPRFAIRTELEYIYRLEATSRNRMDFNQFVSPGPVAPPVLQAVTDNVDFSLEVHTILANAYFDFLVSNRVTLYAGVGIGVAILDAETSVGDRVSELFEDFFPESDSNGTSANFAFQVGLGTRIAITKNIFTDINARYINMGAVSPFGDPGLLRVEAKTIHAAEVLISVGYMF